MLDIVKGVYDISTNIYDRYAKWKSLDKEVSVKIRLLYLECKRNLALLDCISERARKDTKVNESEFLSIAALLETDILEMVFMEGEKETKLFETLSQKVDVELTRDDVSGEEGINSAKQRKSVIQLVMYVYVRVSILKKLASSKEGSKVLKNIKYRKRLENIKSAYISIIKGLSRSYAVKSLHV